MLNAKKKSPFIRTKKVHEDSDGIWLVSYADMVTLLMGFFALLLSFSKLDAEKFEKMKKESTKLFGGEYVIPFEKLTNDLKEVIKKSNLEGTVLFSQTDNGIEITFQGALFFESGSINLRKDAEDLLQQLIPVIKEQTIKHSIVIEGHTDNTPTSAGIIRSNWELSSLRACTVLHLFQKAGFSDKSLKAIGWGDTKPKVDNIDENSRAINRRVVIKIEKNYETKN